MSVEFILIGFAAFVLADIVYYEFVHAKLRDLGRKFREWMYFEE